MMLNIFINTMRIMGFKVCPNDNAYRMFLSTIHNRLLLIL